MTAAYLADRLPFSEGQLRPAVDALAAADHLDADGVLLKDPTRSTWRQVLQRSDASGRSDTEAYCPPDADACLPLRAGLSSLAKALHVAWAFHEYCSDVVDDQRVLPEFPGEARSLARGGGRADRRRSLVGYGGSSVRSTTSAADAQAPPGPASVPRATGARRSREPSDDGTVAQVPPKAKGPRRSADAEASPRSWPLPDSGAALRRAVPDPPRRDKASFLANYR